MALRTLTKSLKRAVFGDPMEGHITVDHGYEEVQNDAPLDERGPKYHRASVREFTTVQRAVAKHNALKLQT